jgi:Tol biopolymer transport system component
MYVAKFDGSEPRKIASLPGVAEWLRWSKDGLRIRFTLEEAIWEIAPDGSNLHEVLPGWNKPHAECCGTWTFDGRYFVFASSRGGVSNIWAMREEGSFLRRVNHDPVQLTSGTANTGTPVPSVDGKQIFVETMQPRGELVQFDSRTREFRPYLSGMSALALDFSRDGKWITYVNYFDRSLWRSRLDGGDRLQLTSPPLTALMPRWSPDGRQIAFMGQTPGKPWQLYIAPAEGGSLQKPLPAERNQVDPTWSPNGDSVTLSGLGHEASAIRILNLKTQQVSVVPGSEGLSSPRWSPNGRYIAALSNNARKMLLFDFQTKRWTELVQINIGFPQWSHNSEYIYFLGGPSVVDKLQRVRISDRKSEQLADLKSFQSAPGFAGDWMGLAPDDSPLFLRDAGTQDIYALTVELP